MDVIHGKRTLYQLVEDMAMLKAEIDNVNNSIAARAADPKADMADLDKDTERLENLNKRYNIVKNLHATQEADERAKVQAQQAQGVTNDPKTAKLTARAEFYKKALTGGRNAVQNAYDHLGAIPAGTADLNGGENLLPTQMSSEIIAEPFDQNPMRDIITITNITGLEVPKIAYTVDDAFIDDTKTATELELEGDIVTFGRNKLKVEARVSDTVLHGTPLGLQAFIDNALRSGLAGKEKAVMFNASAATAEQHMSLYGTGIAEVEGETMLDAILAAYGDLNDKFAGNARVVMRRADWAKILRDMANSSAPLWGAKPEDIIGIPITFVDSAVTPVVGDFSYLHLNYDLGTVYNTDMDGKAGIYQFFLTAWFDVQVKLKSAFRLAKVAENP